MSSQIPSRLMSAYQHLNEARIRLSPVFQGRDGMLPLRHIRDQSADEIEANLRVVFAEAEDGISFELLATYLVGAQIALMQWWLEERQPYTVDKLALPFIACREQSFGMRSGQRQTSNSLLLPIKDYFLVRHENALFGASQTLLDALR